MLARIVRISVRKPGVILVLALLLLVYGGFQLSTASLDIFPEFSAKRIVIQTEAPGLSPEQVEALITLPVERSLSGLIGLESIRSESLQGLSVVTTVFDDNTDLHLNRQRVGERLSSLLGQLPPGAGPPLMVPLSSSSATVLTVGLASDTHNLMDLRTLADWTLVPRLLSVPGVADVNVFGGLVRQLQIQLKPLALARHGLGVEDVLRAAELATGMRGSGFVENQNQRISLQLVGLPDTAENLKQVVLTRKDGVNVTLGDVATIVDAARPPIGAATVGGKPAIVMMVIGQYGANTLEVSRRTEQVLAEFQQLLGKQGIKLYPSLFRPADYVEISIRSLGGHLLAGAGLVLLVLYLFLLNFRVALISAIAIPLSLLGAVVVLLAANVNLNIMVLGGLAIALGEVVDDAIIDVENIYRRLRENQGTAQPKPAYRVVYAASMEVRGSMIYSTLIVALSFLPLLTLGGLAGRLFAPLGFSYILAILLSLLVALTVTPALSLLLLGKRTLPSHAPPLLSWLQPGYGKMLGWVSFRAGQTLLGSGLILVLALLLMPRLGGDFLPKLREGHYILHTTAMPGTSLQESLRMGGELSRRLLQIAGVVSVSQWAGRAERSADTYGSHYSEYEVHLKPMDGSVQQAVLDQMRAILDQFPGLDYEVNTFLAERIDETLTGYTAPVVVNVYGGDLTQADAKAQEIAALMEKMTGATEVQVRSPAAAPLLQIRLLPERLESFGIRPLEAATALQTAFDGKVVGRFYQDSRAFDVSLILAPELRQQLDSVAELPLRTPEGTLIPLKNVADIQQVTGRYNILHRGGQRVQTVTAHVAGRDLDSFQRELEKRVLQEIQWPAEMHPEFTGASKEQGLARQGLFLQGLVAGVGILLLTYLAMGNLRLTLLILVNLPFSLVGGFLGAYFSAEVLTVGSMVGFVTLFGITVRNSIMLLSHYRHLVEVERKPWGLAVLLQGAQERLPAILMTALVTALAMLPIALNSDNPGREIMGPMAGIIVGGLVTSTLLNLLLLPTLTGRFGRFD